MKQVLGSVVALLGIASILTIASGCGGDGATPAVGLVRAAAARTGNFGMRADIGQASAATALVIGPRYVEDDTPANAQQYAAAFWVRSIGLPLADGDEVEIFNGYSTDGTAQFQTIVERSSGETRLTLAARLNDGTYAETAFGTEAVLPTGYSQVVTVFDSVAGSFRALVNGAGGPGLTGLTNSNSRIDSVRLGAVGGTLDAGTVGFLDFDDFGQGAPGALGTYTAVDGLPPGSTIVFESLEPVMTGLTPGWGQPGGVLGGERVTVAATGAFNVTGTGALAGYSRLLQFPLDIAIDMAPAPPPAAIQTIPIELVDMQGTMFGDPDFDVLGISVGSLQGLPSSSGQTTLTELPSGAFQIDSFFDITYEIEFVGAPGGFLDGFSGTTTAQFPASLDFFEAELIFADGFESGDVLAWSGSVP